MCQNKKDLACHFGEVYLKKKEKKKKYLCPKGTEAMQCPFLLLCTDITYIKDNSSVQACTVTLSQPCPLLLLHGRQIQTVKEIT